jgi:hypothetical protein
LKEKYGIILPEDNTGGMMKKIILLLLWSFCSLAALFGQEYPRGTILDEALYNSLPRKAVQLSRNYEALPRSVSLKQYAPYTVCQY